MKFLQMLVYKIFIQNSIIWRENIKTLFWPIGSKRSYSKVRSEWKHSNTFLTNGIQAQQSQWKKCVKTFKYFFTRMGWKVHSLFRLFILAVDNYFDPGDPGTAIPTEEVSVSPERLFNKKLIWSNSLTVSWSAYELVNWLSYSFKVIVRFFV